MQEDLLEKIRKEIDLNLDQAAAPKAAATATAAAPTVRTIPGVTEFVGATAVGKTIGLVIANVDPQLLETMNVEKKYKSIGIIGDRTGAGPHIFAADEAVKATNTEIIAIELPRDTEGGAGHGSFIIFGAQDVSDVRRAVQVTLQEIDTRVFGDVYGNEAGHVELDYTARASFACNKAFGAPIGKSFAAIVGAPAAIGLVMADKALKSANVDVVGYSSPAHGTSFSNEVILTISGDSGAVRQSVIAAREIGIKLLGTLGSEPKSSQPSYI
ncbi:MAG: propanediol utilization microcompartment protein PduB [Lachnospiraceae bacterium]|nr:propanediol utilization microcompartment protein PduB [Lachnospiraceae bacterium]